MTGVAPDGSAIAGGGLSVAVLRRQAGGKWLIVIDNPFGDAPLQGVMERGQLDNVAR
jgi:ketosteroid isomerase-like protein